MIRCWLALTYYLYALRLAALSLIHYIFLPSKSSLHPENQSAGCFLLGNLPPFGLSTGITTQCAFIIKIDKTSTADIIQKQPALQNDKVQAAFSCAAA